MLMLRNAGKSEQGVGKFGLDHFDIPSTKHWSEHNLGILVKYLLKNELMENWRIGKS